MEPKNCILMVQFKRLRYARLLVRNRPTTERTGLTHFYHDKDSAVSPPFKVSVTHPSLFHFILSLFIQGDPTQVYKKNLWI